MKNQIHRQSLLFFFCWRFRRHFVALCATQLLTFDFFIKAQAPQGIPYQAIARNASGQAIASTPVKVRFSIRDSIATGAIKYQETHNPTTSALGLFSVNVGMGTVVSGTFSGINWGKNAKFLQMEMDPAGGSTYTDLGTTQMMSVPYALYASEMPLRISNTGDTLFIGSQKIQITGLSNSKNNGPVITDIDGNVYQTVIIGSQTWMKENLKVGRYRNGDPLTYSSDYYGVWASSNPVGLTVNYNNDNAYFETYGRLYNWYAVNDSRGLCPAGWHVPSEMDWITLEDYLGGPSVAGLKLKGESNLWRYTPTVNSNNQSGFSALPAGSYDPVFSSAGDYTTWWSSTEDYSIFAKCRGVGYSSRSLAGRGSPSPPKKYGYSVRCLKD